MKTILLSIAILASASSAFANEAGDERASREAFAGAATRAEVRSVDPGQQRRWEQLERPFVTGLDAGWREVARQREKLVQLLLRERPPAQRERELHGS